jgi:hypothetical protein
MVRGRVRAIVRARARLIARLYVAVHGYQHFMQLKYLHYVIAR